MRNVSQTNSLVPVPRPQSVRLGHLLVQQGILREEQVQHILTVQSKIGRPFGDLAERLFGVEPKIVEDAWVKQYTQILGQTDPFSLAVDPACLALVNRRQAWQFSVAPVRRDENELLLLTTPRHLVRASNFAAHVFPESTFFRVADENAMRAFLMNHYPVPQHLADLADRLH